MGAALVVVALPARYVVVGEAGIFASTVEDHSMEARLEAYSIERLPCEARLNPEAWKGVARGLRTAKLVVLKKSQRMDVDAESAGLVVSEAVVRGRQARGQVILSHNYI